MSTPLGKIEPPGPYSHFGSTIGTAHTERPQPEDPYLDVTGVRRRLDWTLEKFNAEKNSNGFPIALSTDQRNAQRWRTSAIDAWVAGVRAEIVRLTALVARAK